MPNGKRVKDLSKHKKRGDVIFRSMQSVKNLVGKDEIAVEIFCQMIKYCSLIFYKKSDPKANKQWAVFELFTNRAKRVIYLELTKYVDNYQPNKVMIGHGEENLSNIVPSKSLNSNPEYSILESLKHIKIYINKLITEEKSKELFNQDHKYIRELTNSKTILNYLTTRSK